MSRTQRWTVVGVVLLASVSPSSATETREGVFNGGFELGMDRSGSRPAHWNIGFPGEAPPTGGWALVAGSSGAGNALELHAENENGFFFSQAADLPASSMEGVEVDLSVVVEVPQSATWAAVQLVALNPEAEVDPTVGVGHVGHLLLTAPGVGRHELADSVTLTGPAEFIAIVLIVAGNDVSAVFDEVSVTADVARRSCGPPVHDTVLPASGLPGYPIGFTNESVRNPSDRALADLTARLAESSDLINLFAHIRWNILAGLPLLDGHERIVSAGDAARRYGLRRMLTFDFTHADLEGIGDLNPMPDGTPVGRLDDPGVAAAYVDELAALVEATGATIVAVGIETDFFWIKHADQWPAFRSMLCSAHDRLHAMDPTIHVTNYFTLESLVLPDLSPNIAGQAAFRELAPCFDSVGYSYYPADGARHLDDIPTGMFTAATEVAPGMPLIIPEFGYRSDGVYSEQEQADFIRRAIDELAGRDVIAMVVYSLYDQTYFGAEPFFQEAFRTIGVLALDGRPKQAWRLFRRIRWLREESIPTGIAPAAQCVVPPRSGHTLGEARP